MRFLVGLRLVARATLLVLSPVTLALAAVVLTGPPSASGVGYIVALLALTAGAMVPRLAWRERLAVAGVLLLLVTVTGRLAFAGRGRDLAFHEGVAGEGRLVDRLFDEEDVAVTGARALGWTNLIPDPDVPELPRIMSRAYARMRDDEGATPSPVVATYVGLESAEHEDTLEIGDVASSAGVVVFLHGYAGSFTLPCWVVARAARDAGFATVCPATRWVGDWWTSGGEATLRRTVDDLRRRGARKLVLAGLSNGGLGASLLAPRFGGTFAGLVLVSGTASSEYPVAHVPTLVLQGERDTQMSAAEGADYARRAGARYVSLDAGHFAMLTREEQVVREITAFLRAR